MPLRPFRVPSVPPRPVLALVLALCGLPGGRAAAWEHSDGRPDAPWSWPPNTLAGECDQRLAEALGILRLAMSLNLAPALLPDGERRQQLLIAAARRTLDSSAVRCPEDPRLPYVRALAVHFFPAGTRWIRGHEVLRDEALEDLLRCRRRDPAFLPARVAFELGILYSLRDEHERAAEEFARSLQNAPPDALATPPIRTIPALLAERLFGSVSASLARYNLADTLVSRPGRLQEALTLFRETQRALRDRPGNATYRLARWGEALALHRMGRSTEALEVLRDLVEVSTNPEELQGGEGVFYAPPAERYHYHALIHLAVGLDAKRTRPQRCHALERARADFARYRASAPPPSPPWLPVVDAEMARIEARARRLGCPLP